MKWIIYIVAITLIACNNEPASQQVTPEGDTTVTLKDTIPAPMHADTLNQQMDTVVQVKFGADSSAITLEGHLNKKGDPLIYYVPVKKGNKISVQLTPEKPRDNIRISHIQMPDGNTDGPFGQSLDYKLKGPGLYKLYISPNRMAGDPAAVDFKIRIRII